MSPQLPTPPSTPALCPGPPKTYSYRSYTIQTLCSRITVAVPTPPYSGTQVRGATRTQSCPSPPTSLTRDQEDESTEQTPQEKAQRRRAQVRKAQLQHRERKATYIKKLELDVTQIRDATERVDRRCDVLRKENEEMRMMLAQLGAAAVLPSAVEMQVPVHLMQLERLAQGAGGAVAVEAVSQTATINFDGDKKITLAVDEVIQQACYQIIPAQSGAEAGAAQIPPNEEDAAINFILA